MTLSGIREEFISLRQEFALMNTTRESEISKLREDAVRHTSELVNAQNEAARERNAAATLRDENARILREAANSRISAQVLQIM